MGIPFLRELSLACSFLWQDDCRHVCIAQTLAEIPKDRIFLNSSGPNILVVPPLPWSTGTKAKLRSVNHLGVRGGNRYNGVRANLDQMVVLAAIKGNPPLRPR